MTELFAINGTWLWPPDGYEEVPMPIVGYNLRGEPVRQGYPSIRFTWQILLQDRMTALLAAYDPTTPQVQITYIDANTGELVTRWAMMEEPVIGARSIVYYNNVAVRFSRITEMP